MSLNEKIDSLKEELIEATREVLQIKSTEEAAVEGGPFGAGPKKALEKALEISSKLGFKTVNLDGYVGYAEYGEGEDYVAVLGHLDVVPEGDGWMYPPYGAEIHDGKIYARGSLDDKGPVMAALFGLKAIKDLNLPVSKRVRVIFGLNEETGDADIEHYNKKEKPPVAGFTPDAEYPIIFAEKGIIHTNLKKQLKASEGDLLVKAIKGGVRPNMVPDYCEAVVEAKDQEKLLALAKSFSENNSFDINAEVKDNLVILKSIGVSAHGSMPHMGKNAVMQLFKFLGELSLAQKDLAEYIAFVNKAIGFETDGTSIGVGFSDEASGKLSLNAGVMAMDENSISLSIDIRYPVTIEGSKIIDILTSKASENSMEISKTEPVKPLYYPPEHPVIQKLQKVYKEQTGEEPKLLAIGGGTYAKAMPNIVAFGPIFPGKPDLDHQANEYIEVEDLLLNCKIYASAIYELAK